MHKAVTNVLVQLGSGGLSTTSAVNWNHNSMTFNGG